jgi:regulator of nucleoside diphosphate kinase
MDITQNRKFSISREDYAVLSEFLSNNVSFVNDERCSALIDALKDAEKGDGNSNVVGLNSSVVIRDHKGLKYVYTVVLPELADHRKCQVSVFSLIGSALFGRTAGDEIFWDSAIGKRHFTILSVNQLKKMKLRT